MVATKRYHLACGAWPHGTSSIDVRRRLSNGRIFGVPPGSRDLRPTRLPTNAFAVNSAQYLLGALGKAFPQRIIAPPIPFANSISDLLASSLASPSTSVRQAARRAFDTMSDYYDAHSPGEKREALKEAVA